MRKTVMSIVAVLLFGAPALAGEFRSSDGLFVVDLSSGWKQAGSGDPAVVLGLEREKAFARFAKLEDTLNWRYLKMRLMERVESLRAKGVALSGDVRVVSLHGVSEAFYTVYMSGETERYIAFFTYNEASFEISAGGLTETEFRAALATIRKPGEKIELPKPPKPKKIRPVKKKKTPPDAGASPQGVPSSTATDTR